MALASPVAPLCSRSRSGTHTSPKRSTRSRLVLGGVDLAEGGLAVYANLFTPESYCSRATRETIGVLIMRKPIATVFNYSLDGLLADPDTEFWKFCFDLQI